MVVMNLPSNSQTIKFESDFAMWDHGANIFSEENALIQLKLWTCILHTYLKKLCSMVFYEYCLQFRLVIFILF